jgi:hypothetical protein
MTLYDVLVLIIYRCQCGGPNCLTHGQALVNVERLQRKGQNHMPLKKPQPFHTVFVISIRDHMVPHIIFSGRALTIIRH